MSEDSSGKQKIYFANFEAFFYNTDSSVTRIGIILNRVLDQEQIDFMRQAEALKEFERKRAVLLKEEEYLKESVTSAINESIDFISRINDIYSYRQRKTYYEKKKGIFDMLTSLVNSESLLEKEKKNTIKSILGSISANSNLDEQNAFCKDALDSLKTFSKEISEEEVTFVDPLPPFSSSSSSSSSSSVDTESEKYKSSIQRIIKRVLESNQKLIGEDDVKSKLKEISDLMNQKEIKLDTLSYNHEFNHIYSLIEPTLTELNEKILHEISLRLSKKHSSRKTKTNS